MSITRPSTMSPEEIEKLSEKMAGRGKGMLTQHEVDKVVEGLVNRGARVEMKDPRVSAIHNWVIGTIGFGIVSAIGIGISQMSELNKNVAILIERDIQKDRADASQDRRFDNSDRRMDSFDERLRKQEQKP